jgi:histone H2A
MSTAAAASVAPAPAPTAAALKKKSGSKPGVKKISKSKRAGLIMPVGRIHTTIKKGCYHNGHLSQGAPIFLSGVLQYLMTELMELSSLKLVNGKKDEAGIRITPRRILLAINEDNEFSALFRNVKIPNAGTVPTLRAKKVSDFKNELMGVAKKIDPSKLKSAEDAPKAAEPTPAKKKADKAAEKAADKKKAKPPKDADMVDDGENEEEDEFQ